MNWFDNNPLGKVLASAGGVLGLAALLMAWAWNWEVSSGADPEPLAPVELPPPAEQVVALGPLSEYRVVTDRPVFNATRQPVVTVESDVADIEIEETGPAEIPPLRLTGVVITPGSRFATLSPQEGGEPVVAREGEALDGPLVGWTVASIEPRNVIIESTEGESLALELVVHDQMIAEPPKPEPPPEAVAEAGDGDGDENNEGQPMSRADQIRQRIEQRREELRREAEAERERKADSDGGTSNNYQRTIQQMLQRNRDNDDEKDQEDSDGGN